MGQLLEVLEFADCIGGHAFCVFFLDLDLLYSNKLGCISSDVTQVDIGIGSFSEFLAYTNVR